MGEMTPASLRSPVQIGGALHLGDARIEVLLGGVWVPALSSCDISEQDHFLISVFLWILPVRTHPSTMEHLLCVGYNDDISLSAEASERGNGKGLAQAAQPSQGLPLQPAPKPGHTRLSEGSLSLGWLWTDLPGSHTYITKGQKRSNKPFSKKFLLL